MSGPPPSATSTPWRPPTCWWCPTATSPRSTIPAHEDEALVGHLFSVARQIAAQEGIDQTGYRLIINTGPHAGQVVFHLHLHVIGGQRMRFPMG